MTFVGLARNLVKVLLQIQISMIQKRPNWLKNTSNIYLKLNETGKFISHRLRKLYPARSTVLDIIVGDYAQQLHYPTNTQQPGPIYFKTPRKCGLFGVVSERSGHQFNYLIDEPVAVGKGANATISYVHHFLENHGMGEQRAYFHADNCAGKKIIYSFNLLQLKIECTEYYYGDTSLSK